VVPSKDSPTSSLQPAWPVPLLSLVLRASLLSQDAQKGRPARPQRVKARGVPLWYVEGLNDARTKLAAFFSILSVLVHDGFKIRPTDYLSIEEDPCSFNECGLLFS